MIKSETKNEEQFIKFAKLLDIELRNSIKILHIKIN